MLSAPTGTQEISASKCRPILFSHPMVRALPPQGNKTQTRRVVKLHGNDGIQTDHSLWRFCEFHDNPRRAVWQHVADLERVITEECPYGKVGDRLWVRETWRSFYEKDTGAMGIQYFAGGFEEIAIPNTFVPTGNDNWRPSIFMPRWASRITLEITDIRVERVQSISAEDAIAEGISKTDYWKPKEVEGRPFEEKWWDDHEFWQRYPQIAYRKLWNSINAKGVRVKNGNVSFTEAEYKHPHSWESNPWVWVVVFRRVEGL